MLKEKRIFRLDAKNLISLLMLGYIIFYTYSYSKSGKADISGILTIDTSSKNPIFFISNNSLIVDFLLIYCFSISDYIYRISEFRYSYVLSRTRDRSAYLKKILASILKISTGLVTIFVFLMWFLFGKNTGITGLVFAWINYSAYLATIGVFIDVIYLISGERNMSIAISIFIGIFLLYAGVWGYYLNFVYLSLRDGLISLVIRLCILAVTSILFKKIYLKKDFI